MKYKTSDNPALYRKVPPGKTLPVEKTAAYTVVADTDYCLVGDGASAVVPFTLPALSTLDDDTHYEFLFVAKDITNAVTVVAAGADTGKINGANSVTIPAAYAGFLVFNGPSNGYWIALPMQVNT